MTVEESKAWDRNAQHFCGEGMVAGEDKNWGISDMVVIAGWGQGIGEVQNKVSGNTPGKMIQERVVMRNI